MSTIGSGQGPGRVVRRRVEVRPRRPNGQRPRNIQVVSTFPKLKLIEPFDLTGPERPGDNTIRNLRHLADQGIAISQHLLSWIRDDDGSIIREFFAEQDLTGIDFKTDPETGRNALKQLLRDGGYVDETNTSRDCVYSTVYFKLSYFVEGHRPSPEFGNARWLLGLETIWD